MSFRHTNYLGILTLNTFHLVFLREELKNLAQDVRSLNSLGSSLNIPHIQYFSKLSPSKVPMLRHRTDSFNQGVQRNSSNVHHNHTPSW